MARKFVTPIDLQNNKAINVADPTAAQDAATKNYVDNLGSVVQAPAIGARIFNSAAISIANNVVTALSFNSERYDTDTIHDTVTNNTRMTCRTAGLYDISASVEWAGPNATGHRSTHIRLNGATFIAGESIPPSSDDVTRQTISTQYSLAAGDYVEVIVSQSSGGALNVNASANQSPEFSMVRVPGASSVLLGPQAPAIAAKAGNTAAQALVTGTVTVMTLGTTRYDNDTMTSVANRLTVKTAGIYEIGGLLHYVLNGTGDRGIGLRLNGGTYVDWVLDVAAVNQSTRLNASVHVSLVPGDYIELIGWQTSGGNLNTQTGTDPTAELWAARIPGSQGAALGVTSVLPTSPVDGQECYYLADATNGVIWHLKYRAASASTFKWEYVGGAPLFTKQTVTNSSITTTTATAFTNRPSDITLPLAGDYDVRFGARLFVQNPAGSNIALRLFAGATDVADIDHWQGSAGTVTTLWAGAEVQAARLTGRAINDLLQLRAQVAAGSTGVIDTAFIEVHPVRVG
jgi:hypothetical protein